MCPPSFTCLLASAQISSLNVKTWLSTWLLIQSPTLNFSSQISNPSYHIATDTSISGVQKLSFAVFSSDGNPTEDKEVSLIFSYGFEWNGIHDENN